ncbi:uncharacterized protein [Sinocyclocheilus grahami]|uniref:uncharacterized protein isoform X1 n=2 Tax=Sinocyclocheilus grahami TaxID=75366 RepID=UPI0007AD562D|nr:PREDICTED: uncharacterized protein LOC107566771 isoform X1 [Sinocyclocheilus grahami]
MDACFPVGRLQSGAVGAGMSAARGPSGLSMNTVELKHQWAMQRNRTLVRTYLLSSSVLPLPVSWSRDYFRLPSLSRSTHGRTTTVPLSISEPCLFTPGQRAVFEGFSKNRRPLLHKRGPSSPSCKTLENTKVPQQSYHQVYMHFSQPLKPVPKVGQAFTHSQRRATENRGLQALVRQHKQPINLETLSVRGQTFLPTQHLPTSSSSAPRTQLHVFLPAEGARQEEDGQ